MRLLSRRELLLAAASYAMIDRSGSGTFADVPAGAKPIDATSRGRQFLESLFDPTLGLLPEYRGAKVYWLFHDNYLAAKVLGTSNPALAQKIKTSIQRFGIDHSGKIEIIFDEVKQPLPFRQYRLNEVQRVGDKIVRTEMVTDVILKGWQEYADLLFLAALAEPEPKQARRRLEDGMKLWDGVGFKDRAAAKDQQYAAYKLALSLIAAAKLGVKPDALPAITERLLSQQAKDGGWITDYDEKGKPDGMANVETTCLAVLGLEAVART